MKSQATVFLCDDDEDVRNAVSFHLGEAEFDVRIFGSGADLLSAIEAEPKPLRAIFVLDLDMPPMDGDVLHDQLIARGYAKRSPVIFLSSRGTIARAVLAVNKGALDFVEKPHTNGTLVPLLHRAVDLEAEMHQRAKRCEFLLQMRVSLTPQETKVAALVAEGNSNSAIASMLGIGERMVEVHRSRAYEKLGVDKPAALATTIADMKACGISIEP